ncbi:hypothetical protein Lal_00002379 [Lupinus albus]|nr:hypothetical protein Lal_00002379 [Lupinus albus]
MKFIKNIDLSCKKIDKLNALNPLSNKSDSLAAINDDIILTLHCKSADDDLGIQTKCVCSNVILLQFLVATTAIPSLY